MAGQGTGRKKFVAYRAGLLAKSGRWNNLLWLGRYRGTGLKDCQNASDQGHIEAGAKTSRLAERADEFASKSYPLMDHGTGHLDEGVPATSRVITIWVLQ